MPNKNEYLIKHLKEKIVLGIDIIGCEIETAINQATESEKACIVLALSRAGYKDAAKFITLEYGDD